MKTPRQPVRPRTWLAVWDVEIDEPARFRVVGRRGFWRWRRGESGGLGGCYAMFSLPVLLVAALVILDSVHFMSGQTSVSWLPFLVAVGAAGAWLGWPVLLGLLPDVVWEAHNGELRLAGRTYLRADVDHLVLEDHRWTSRHSRPGGGTAPQGERATRLFLVSPGGSRIELARFQTAPQAAARLCRRLAAASGFPLHTGKAARAELSEE
jgi:hypothetical protein